MVNRWQPEKGVRLSPHAQSLVLKLESVQIPVFMSRSVIEIAHIPEARHSITPKSPRSPGRNPSKPTRPGPQFITFGTFNARSIYDHERASSHFMQEEDISYIAVTEPMLRPGEPPKGLPNSTLAQGG